MARILLVEDEDPVRAFVKRALETDGHTVLEASDGEDGIDLFIAEGGKFDLLLTDIRMPIMDGIELAHMVRQQNAQIPILLMTGFAEQRERASSLSGIVTDVLTKPFTLVDLKKTVSLILG
ncbi:response regulator [Microvirga sp. W0021]|uniref:Response regulator n=1 Tax=Hohaiivirga grylli TaxID=3133970 RepID=A0ABV0BKW8_9HYPH